MNLGERIKQIMQSKKDLYEDEKKIAYLKFKKKYEIELISLKKDIQTYFYNIKPKDIDTADFYKIVTFGGLDIIDNQDIVPYICKYLAKEGLLVLPLRESSDNMLSMIRSTNKQQEPIVLIRVGVSL